MSKDQTTEESESILPIDEHEEIVSEGGKQVRRRGVYLLPNLLTLGALFAGFYAVIAGMSGNFNEAGWAILIAGVLDGLDGRIARLTRSQSAFGAEFDSLSDMVSFGMAPALIMFSWAFEPLGRVGWAASFFYMACAALRLAAPAPSAFSWGCKAPWRRVSLPSFPGSATSTKWKSQHWWRIRRPR